MTDIYEGIIKNCIAKLQFERKVLPSITYEQSLKNKTVMTEVAKIDGRAICLADNSLLSDKDVILAAVSNRGTALEYADEKLKADKEIVLSAVSQNYKAIYEADKDLQKDPDVVLAAAKNNECFLKSLFHFDKISYKDLALALIKESKNVSVQKISMLALLSPELRNDKEVVLEAVKRYGSDLENASDTLKNDKEVVLEAVKQNGFAFKYATAELRSDDEFITELLKDYPDIISSIDRSGIADDEKAREELVKILEDESVEYFVHFTRIDNLQSIIRRGLITRKELTDKSIPHIFTDEHRYDGVLDSVSLSVTKPNGAMFGVKLRGDSSSNWVVLRLKASEIIRNHPCIFFRVNAASECYGIRSSIKKKERFTKYDLLSMFAGNHPVGRTSDIQAEIMCMDNIPSKEIDTVFFYNENVMQRFSNTLRNELDENNIAVELDKDLYYRK